MTATAIVKNLLEEAETIAKCAVRLNDGRILTGAIHATIFSQAWTDGLFGEVEEEEEAAQAARRLGWTNGFVTSSGRFVGRREAYKIARAARQVDADQRKSLYHDMINPQ